VEALPRGELRFDGSRIAWFIHGRAHSLALVCDVPASKGVDEAAFASLSGGEVGDHAWGDGDTSYTLVTVDHLRQLSGVAFPPFDTHDRATAVLSAMPHLRR